MLDVKCEYYETIIPILNFEISFYGYKPDKKYLESYILLPYLYYHRIWRWTEDKLFFDSKEEAIEWAKYISNKINRNRELIFDEIEV